MKNRTVIAIAYRLNTIRIAGKTIEIDKGRVVLEGRHDGLDNADGLIKSL